MRVRLAGDTIDFFFTTRLGADPATLGGTPAVQVYRGNSITQITAGITLTVDFDGVTGLNHVRIVTSDAAYLNGDDYQAIVSTGTVGGVSIAPYVIPEGAFRLDTANLASMDTKLDTIDDFLDTEIAAILADVAELNDTKIPDTISLAAINAEVVDCLNVDTYAEPGQGVPPAAPTIRQMTHYTYKAWRNRSTLNATDYNLYADDGTTVDQNATVSDDATTFDRGEVGTGP